MEDERKLKQAQNVYETLCKMLDNKELKYKRFEEDLAVTCTVSGDDIPMDFIFRVNPGAQVVTLYSPMPFKIAEEKRVDAALAVCVANYGLVNGTFDYDLSDGEIRFRVVSSFRESILSEELFFYMILIAMKTVDDYNDKFLMISKGMMSMEQFLEWENSNNS